MLVNCEVGDEPPSVAAYRAGGPKLPAASLAGTYARFLTGPSFDELAASTTAWLKANKPEVLDSKVEKALPQEGVAHRVDAPLLPQVPAHRARVGRG